LILCFKKLVKVMLISPLCRAQKAIHNIASIKYSIGPHLLQLIYPIISTAASAFLFYCGIACVNVTGTSIALSSHERVYDGRSTADTGLYGNGVKRAVAAACSAFHAGIAILNDGMRAIHFKNFMRANFHTHSAARTLFFVEL
jgi:hypothetical protein